MTYVFENLLFRSLLEKPRKYTLLTAFICFCFKHLERMEIGINKDNRRKTKDRTVFIVLILVLISKVGNWIGVFRNSKIVTNPTAFGQTIVFQQIKDQFLYICCN